MGKSTKKSASKVAAAAVVAPAPTKPLKKGKREADGVIVKKEAVRSKKQKVGAKKNEIKVEKTVSKKKAESSSEDEPEEETKDQVNAPAKNGDVGSDPNSDSSGLEEDAPKKPAAVAAAVKNKENSSSDDSDDLSEDESSDEEAAPMEAPAAAPKAVAAKAPAATKKNDDSGDEESSDDAEKAESSEDESEEEESDEEDDKAPKTPMKNDTDVEMTDASAARKTKKNPNTPATPKEQSTLSKTLFVGNLSFSIEKVDVENFFKSAGEIVDVRFAMAGDNSFRGFGHVEFATPEQAAKALEELNGHDLLGREVRLDLAKEKQQGEAQSFQRPPKVQGQTVFVRGFDKSDAEEQIRSSLEEHFGSCGEITRVSIPKAEDGGVKGIAYIDFKDANAFNLALELNGSDLGSSNLIVEEAKPRGDGPSGGGRSGGSGRGRGRGRFGDSGRGRGRGRGRFGGSGRGRGGR